MDDKEILDSYIEYLAQLKPISWKDLAKIAFVGEYSAAERAKLSGNPAELKAAHCIVLGAQYLSECWPGNEFAFRNVSAIRSSIEDAFEFGSLLMCFAENADLLLRTNSRSCWETMEAQYELFKKKRGKQEIVGQFALSAIRRHNKWDEDDVDTHTFARRTNIIAMRFGFKF